MRFSDVDFTDLDVREFIADQESQDIKSGDEFKDVLMAALDHPTVWGWELPWDKTVDEFRLRPAEVSLWAGMGGHLKSAVVQQIAFWQAQHRKVGIMSFEMPISAQLRRAVHQCAGVPNVAREWAGDFADWMRDRVYFYDRIDSVAPERVLACVLYMAQTLGVEFVVIDCLIKVRGIARDADREASFMDQLMAMAKALNIHIVLVHHIRKPDKMGDAYRPNKYDVRGAGDLVDQASSVVIVWNDKKRKQISKKIEQGYPVLDTEREYHEKSRDLIIDVVKQRDGAFEGRFGFFVHDSMQISSHPSRRMHFELV